MTEDATADREIVIERILNAPRELVFKAWTEQEQVGRWWGPNGFTTTTHEMDVRPGGRWRFIMHGPDGRDYEDLVVYREVVAPERLVYRHSSWDENDPYAFDVSVVFAEQDGKTKLTMRSVFATAEARRFVIEEFGAIEGGNQTLDRLEAHLSALMRSGPS